VLVLLPLAALLSHATKSVAALIAAFVEIFSLVLFFPFFPSLLELGHWDFLAKIQKSSLALRRVFNGLADLGVEVGIAKNAAQVPRE
jgi:hypothetical protein